MQELVSSALNDLGYELVRLSFHGSTRPTLQVMAERADGGLDIEDCEIISRHLSALFDVEDPIDGNYVLEVSSPGIDRPLMRISDFEKYTGHIAKIELATLPETIPHRRFTGRIQKVVGDNIFVIINEGAKSKQNLAEQTLTVPFDCIAKAKLVLTDELLQDERLHSPQTTGDMS